MARLAAMKRQSEWFSHFFDAAYVAQLREEKSPADTRAEVDFLVRRLSLPRGARILDVPCGYGRHAAALARRGFVVLGLDLSRAMIAEGRRRFTEGPRLRLRRADMRRIAFREEFDAVVNLYTSFGYFEPAENQAVLRRMARALKPGGRMAHVVDLGGHDQFEDPMPPLEFQVYPDWLYSIMYSRYGRATRQPVTEYVRQAQAAGFKQVSAQPIRQVDEGYLNDIWPHLNRRMRQETRETVRVIEFILAGTK